MNANTKSQAHQLRQSWAAEDHALEARQAATVAAQYQQLTSQNSQAMQAEFAAMWQQIQANNQRVQRVERHVDFGALRTQIVIWGVGSSAITAVVMSLILAPFNAPQQQKPTYQPQQFERQIQPRVKRLQGVG